MLPLVYIAGPYTHPDPVLNVRRSIETASRLYDSGKVVPLIPHLTMLWQLVDPKPLDHWYEYDLHLLRRCDAVLVIPGKSAGAEAEAKLALDLGMPLFDDEQELLEWAARQG
jgi:hypothetical protein